MRSIRMSSIERLFYHMRFGEPERTKFLISTLGESRIQSMGEKIILTFDDAQDIAVFRHRYGIGCEAKTLEGIIPFVTLRTQSIEAIRRVADLLIKKLRAPSRVNIVLDEIKGIEY